MNIDFARRSFNNNNELENLQVKWKNDWLLFKYFIYFS